jgi:hypothetical protein
MSELVGLTAIVAIVGIVFGLGQKPAQKSRPQTFAQFFTFSCAWGTPGARGLAFGMLYSCA